ncbi:restriction endonuclease subunit S [Acinetobacter sp. Marseille-Q1623]|uniref:restriction endonuclease subunit S n=1 Tax=Acinetobacter sp. Marseille-Q1623 TaxID=2697501 RepID=UPI00157B4067|nr:restriction endonuclease subunit S [Acinetobacter sp. Marseille-Q1623]
MNLDNLPVEWYLVPFTDLLDVQGGTQPPKSEFIDQPSEGYIRLLQIRDFGLKPVPTYIPMTKKLKTCQKEDILIARYGASLGRICSGMEGAYNVALAKVITPSGIEKTFLKYFLRSDYFQNPLMLLSRSAQNGFNKDDLAKFPFILPPLAEQQEIVRQLDVMLAQVEQIKARLDAIPAILKKFRQSVLADAVSGKLTEEWRGTSEINEWQDKTLGDIAIIKTGKTPSRKESKYWENASIPWLTSSATGNNFTDSADEFISEIASKECNLIPFPKGTLLLAMYGEGKTRGQVTELLIEATCNQACAAILVNNEIAHTSFVKIRLLENYETIRKAASGGNQPNLNLNKVREIDIFLPTLNEQVEIVNIVKNLFVYANKIEETVKSAQKRVNLLTQSILAKAFSGELTAEWREQHQELITGVNSAESLLAKIQAEREANKPVKKTRAKKEV